MKAILYARQFWSLLLFFPPNQKNLNLINNLNFSPYNLQFGIQHVLNKYFLLVFFFLNFVAFFGIYFSRLTEKNNTNI